MKVVFDTNVIISGLLWRKTTKALFDLADNKKITICLTPNIIEEILKVLKYPKIKKQLEKINLTPKEIKNYLLQISEFYPNIDIQVDLPDKSDKIFLEASIISKSQYLITGDNHLLSLGKFQDIQILKVREFLQKYEQKNN